VDRVESAYHLSYPDLSLGNVILFDVWHHLEFPGAALAEFRRVLRPTGRLILFEPAAGSVLGRLVYGLFHPEPVNPPGPLDWSESPAFRPPEQAYYSAQGNCWRIFATGKLPAEIARTGAWRLAEVRLMSAVSYALSGGFSRPQLYPRRAYPLMRRVDRWLDSVPRFSATRMRVVLERR
ncbi:MAG: methyltransferase domain-containing protein, partial [Opitutaceae bacterium]